MKYLISPSHCDNEHDADIAYVIVALDKAEENSIARWLRAAKRLKRQDSDFAEVQFFDYSALFVSSSEAEAKFPEAAGEVDDPIVVESAVKPVEIHAERVEAPYCCVRQSGLYWKATPKHCDFEVESRWVEPHDLKRKPGKA